MQIDIAAPWLIAFMLVLARALAWLMVVSPFSDRRVIPTMVTIGIAAGLAILIAPRLEHTPLPTDTAGLVGALVVQVATGLALGFVVQLLISAVTAAGSMLDQVGGLTLPPSIDPLSLSQTSIMGQFYEQVVVLLLFATNGYLLMVDGFVRSFDGPGFSLHSAGTLASVVVTDLGVFFVSALEMAGPVMVVLFAAQVVLALLSKAAPQANVWLLGFPLQVFLVLVLVSLTISLVPGYVANLLARGLGDGARMFGVV
ncbi:MAG: flagellar biosynthetic protein FliR [Acidimicrobiales bacterium]